MAHLVKSLTGSAAVHTGPCYIYGIHVEGGSDTATVALANQATSGGTRIMGAKALTTAVQDSHFAGDPVSFNVACYATITGTAPIVEIHYRTAPGSS